MPPRLSKRQQRAKEELEALAKPLSSDNDEEITVINTEGGGSSKGPVGFAALLGDDDQEEIESTENEEVNPTVKSRKVGSKKKKKKAAVSLRDQPSQPASTPSLKAPKTKGKPQDSGKLKPSKSKADDDEFEKALAELSGKYSAIRSSDIKGKAPASSSSYDTLYSLLSVSMKNLDPETELRRFFGSKVIASSGEFASKSSRIKSYFARPQAKWPPAQYRAGLSIRALAADELNARGATGDSQERWWTVVASPRYKGATYEYLQCVMGGDPQLFFSLLYEMPWHADTLLQLAEVFRHREEYSTASDFMARALFAYERAFTGAFNLASGYHRLDFNHVENRVFYLAVARNVVDLNRRGTPRTAFEYGRLLFALDPYTDPHGALLHLDYLAIKAKQMEWLLTMWDTFFKMDHGEHCFDATSLPGWTWSRALALFEQETDSDEHHTKSTEALKEAILTFPSIAPLLADKLDITLPVELQKLDAFRVVIDYSAHRDDFSTSILNLLSHIYVIRSHSLWKIPSRSAWFSKTLQSLSSSLFSSSQSSPHPVQRFRELFAFPSALTDAIYRHVLVLSPLVADFRRLSAFFPQTVKARLEGAIEGDPLPPLTAITIYDDSYFLNVAIDNGGIARRMAAPMRGLLGDPAQIQAIIDANPQLAQVFPGGAAELAMLAQNPQQILDVLMGVLGAVPDGVNRPPEGGDGGRMPGGEGFIGLNEQPGPADAPRGGEAGGHSEEQEDEDEDVFEQPSFPLRVVQNLFGRLWRRPAVGEAVDTDSDDSMDAQEEADGTPPDDVD